MTVTMKANRIRVFEGPVVISFEDVLRPTPGTGEVLIRVPSTDPHWNDTTRNETGVFNGRREFGE